MRQALLLNLDHGELWYHPYLRKRCKERWRQQQQQQQQQEEEKYHNSFLFRPWVSNIFEKTSKCQGCWKAARWEILYSNTVPKKTILKTSIQLYLNKWIEVYPNRVLPYLPNVDLRKKLPCLFSSQEVRISCPTSGNRRNFFRWGGNITGLSTCFCFRILWNLIGPTLNESDEFQLAKFSNGPTQWSKKKWDKDASKTALLFAKGFCFFFMSRHLRWPYRGTWAYTGKPQCQTRSLFLPHKCLVTSSIHLIIHFTECPPPHRKDAPVHIGS